MRTASKLRIERAATVLLAAFLISATPRPSLVQKAIHEAESLSLIQNRLQAAAVLLRALPKANKDESVQLREKILQLGKYFYTDKGFQAYLVGKSLYGKQKFSDALDRLQEADELEKSNVDVLHYLVLTELQLQKTDRAETDNLRAIQVCPIDIDLQRDSLAISITQQHWGDAIKKAEILGRDFGDSSAQTLKERGLAAYKLGDLDSAKKLLEQAAQKDEKFPETYFWLGSLSEKDNRKFLTKYVELCKNKQELRYERETNLCSQVSEAERRIANGKNPQNSAARFRSRGGFLRSERRSRSSRNSC